ncbi:MAG: hypothetical protein ABIV06_03545 [Thermoanaerobaculia bacterium]
MRAQLVRKISIALALVAHLGEAQLPYLLADLNPSNAPASYYQPQLLGSLGDTLYFTTEEPSLGVELWMTQGAADSTAPVADLCPGTCSGGPTALGVAGGRFYFVAHYSSFWSDLAVYSVLPSGLDLQRVVAQSDDLRLAFLQTPYPQGYFAEVGGRAVFVALREDGSKVLLTSSGRDNDAVPIFHFSDVLDSRFPQGLTQVDASHVIFFLAPGYDVQVDELWVTDGSTAGTRILRPLGAYAQPSNPQKAGSAVYFLSRTPTGSNLWTTDGTESGSLSLTNFDDPTSRVPSFDVGESRTYFLVLSATAGQELWSTEGTPASTHAATSIGYHEPFGSDYNVLARHEFIAVVGSRAYFIASDGIHNPQLWRTDGAPASAAVVADVCSENECGTSWVEVVGDRALFSGASSLGIEPMVTDAAGEVATVLIDICPGDCSSYPQGQRRLSSGRELFSTRPHEANNIVQLWTTDGTAPRTWSLLNPALEEIWLEYPEPQFVDTDDRLYFVGTSSEFGEELWQAVDKPNSATVVARVQGVVEGSSPRAFLAGGSELYFVVDLEHGASTARLVGGEGGLIPDGGFGCNEFYRSDPVVLGESLLYFTCSETLRRVDPGASAVDVKFLDQAYSVPGAIEMEGHAVFVVETGEGYEVWRSDGSSAGTLLGFTFPPQTSFSGIAQRVSGRAVLSASGPSGHGLYAVSPAVSALQLLAPLGLTPPTLLSPQDGLGFFVLDNGATTTLWRTDATPGGTTSILPLDDSARLLGAMRWQSGYLLLLWRGDEQVDLVRTDGSTGGTEVLSTLAQRFTPVPADMTSFDGHAFFALPGAAEVGLWRSDGTTEGTVRVWTATGGVDLDWSPEVESSDSRLLFTGVDPAHGVELWVLDQATTAPRLLQDILPGAASSTPSSLFRHGDSVYFSASDGLHGPELWVLPPAGVETCFVSERSLCLEQGRFRVDAHWRDFAGNSGDGVAVPITGDTGYFWFFDEDNVELILKLIDGGGFNGHHWVYYGALSNVEYTFTVTDSETGAAKRYFNPATRFASSGDIEAFGPNGAHAAGGPSEAVTLAATPPEVSLAAFSAPQGLPGACVPTPTRFCILNDRFSVTATWRDFAGHTGVANAGTLTDDTGYFWFFSEANIEVVLKMVDAGTFNQHFWVYYGALSNVEYTLTVTDTVAGGSPRVYHNALGHFGSFGDVEAFPAP